jgi:hypothetical protein
MEQSNNAKTQEVIKTKNYQYKITNMKTRVSIWIHTKYELYKDKRVQRRIMKKDLTTQNNNNICIFLKKKNEVMMQKLPFYNF